MLLELLTSAAGGGLLGLGASLIKGWGKYKQKQLDMKHELDMTVQIGKNMLLEMDMAKLKGSLDLEIQESEDDAKNLRAAIEAEASMKGASAWVNDVRAMVRPVLTAGLVILAFTAAGLDFKLAPEFIFMATTAVTFWFGDRPRKSL